MDSGRATGPVWDDLDGPSVACIAAALQLIPDNIPYLLRLQRLAAIGASLPARNRESKLTPTRIRRLLADPLVSGPGVRSQEDPYDDLYVSEVMFHGGPYRVAQGLTSQSGYTASLILKCAFSPAGRVLPVAYRRKSGILAETILKISDLICVRSELTREVRPPVSKPPTVSVPSQVKLRRLETLVKFTYEELTEILPEGGVDVVRRMGFVPGAHELSMASGTDDGLILTPFLLLDSGVIVVNPGELATALRHFLIVLSDEHGCRNALSELLNRIVAQGASQALEILGAVPIEDGASTISPTMRRIGFRLDSDKSLDLFVLTDDLAGYSPKEPYGNWDTSELQSRLQSLDTAGVSASVESKTLHLMIQQGVGRMSILGLKIGGSSAPCISMSLDELQTLVDLNAADPLFLWQFAKQESQLTESAKVLSYSTLDTFALYRNHDDSFYLSDDQKPHFMFIETDWGLDLRLERQRRLDRHYVLGPEGRNSVEVISLYGTNVAPIYFVASDAEGREMLVETVGPTVWVTRPSDLPRDLEHLSVMVQEALCYWIWQISRLAPDLLINACSGRRTLLVRYFFDDPDKWVQRLSDGSTQESSEIWARPGLNLRDGSLRVNLHVAGFEKINAVDNSADRALLKSIVESMVGVAGSVSANAVDLIVDQLAPFGNKRILHGFLASNVRLRSTSEPARLVQPAVLAITMDEIGQWLGDGRISPGPVVDDERTNALRLIVERCFELVASAVSMLHSENLIEKLIAKDEAIVYRQAFDEKTLPARISCFGETSDLVGELVDKSHRYARASMASRFLIEYVAACPPNGGQDLTLECYDRLLGLAAELISKATLSDAIHHGFSDSKLSMLPSGRLGVSTGDRYQAGARALASSHAEILRRTSLQTPQPTPNASNFVPDEAVEAAMAAEFGFSLTELASGLGELVALGDKNCATEPFVMKEEGVRENLKNELGWSSEKIENFLNRLTLGPRIDFLAVGADSYPWRFNRDHSYVRRPLIRRHGAEGTTLVWGARRTWVTGAYWMNLIYAGRLRASTKPMKSLLGVIRQEENRAFERRVGYVIGEAGCPLVEVSVDKVSGRRIMSVDRKDLGDVDVLGINPEKRIVIVAEAKDFELARVPAELANEVSSLLVGEKSALYKHSRRVDWIRKYLPIVLRHFGVSEVLPGWTVRPVIVTSRDLLSTQILTSEIPVVSIDGLRGWTENLWSSSGNRTRRRKK